MVEKIICPKSVSIIYRYRQFRYFLGKVSIRVDIAVTSTNNGKETASIFICNNNQSWIIVWENKVNMSMVDVI